MTNSFISLLTQIYLYITFLSSFAVINLKMFVWHCWFQKPSPQTTIVLWPRIHSVFNEKGDSQKMEYKTLFIYNLCFIQIELLASQYSSGSSCKIIWNTPTQEWKTPHCPELLQAFCMSEIVSKHFPFFANWSFVDNQKSHGTKSIKYGEGGDRAP